MSQFVANTKERRITKFQFTGLFVLVVIVACFAFLRIFYIKTAIPSQELEQLKEMKPIMDSLAILGDKLQAYKQAIDAASAEIPKRESEVNRQSVIIHTIIAGKNINPMYPTMEKVIRIADDYFAFLKGGGKGVQFVNSQFDSLKNEYRILEEEKEDLEEEKEDLKEDKTRLEGEKAQCEEAKSRCRCR